MTNRERFHAVMNFVQADRLPVIEWAPWWDKTLERWRQEGLPDKLTNTEIQEFFGLDPMIRIRTAAARSDKLPAYNPSGIVRSRRDYLAIKPFLYRKPPFDLSAVQAMTRRQETGEAIVWLVLDGFFGFPRALFGIETHLCAFYDNPDLMREMNEDLFAYHLSIVDELWPIAKPDFVVISEDIAYNHGVMLSRRLFDECLAPFYRRIVPALKQRDVLVFTDSDGDVTNLIPWLKDVGVEGLLPFERRSGVDVAAVRRSHPCFRILGAFDKTVMHQGEAAIRAEFERLLPVARQGGMAIACDHQTPPEVSVKDYQLYVRLFREYAALAAVSK